MNINEILKPKSNEEIKKSIDKLINDTPNLPEFIFDHEIEKYLRAFKAYDYIATKLLEESPENLFIIYGENMPLHYNIERQLNSFFCNNKVRKRVRFMGGPFSHALIWSKLVAILQGGTYNTFLISKKNIFKILTSI